MKNSSKIGTSLIFLSLWLGLLMAACSTTSHLPEGEVLYRGIRKLQIDNKDTSEHGAEALEEVQAALDCPPNGALMGSSTIVTPFPVGLWIHNGLSNTKSKFGMWIRDKMGDSPVLMSGVNPALRAKMAINSLQNFGYFRSSVRHEIVPNPKDSLKAKVDYIINMQQPYVLDSITYNRFTPFIKHLLDSTKNESFLRKGDAFNVTNLDSERTRIQALLMNKGYYYYRPEYTTYKADTLQVPWKVQLRVEPIAEASIPWQARHTWQIGDVDVRIQKSGRNRRLRDTLTFDGITYHYRGNRIPVRPKILANNLNFHPGDLYSLEDQLLTQQDLTSMNTFSQLDMTYTPRDTTDTCRILDLTIDARLDKPLSAELSTDIHTKSNGQIGPSLKFGIERKNVFRGGETFRVDVNGSYEWQTRKVEGLSAYRINSYEVGASVSLEFPRIMFPNLVKFKSKHPRKTVVKLSGNNLHRAGYFDYQTFTTDLTYSWQHVSRYKYSFTPFRLTFAKLGDVSDEFKEIMLQNTALYRSMEDQFVPAMSFSFTYDNSVVNPKNRTWWQTTFTEGGNMLSLIDLIAGRKFNEPYKEIFGNPYAQFLKVTTEYRKNFTLTEHTSLATRAMAGIIWTYGNSQIAPYNEQFYVGGANSIRAFTVRSVGPGSLQKSETEIYTDRTGDLKLEANVEYRFDLFGNFKGAVFLDAGNIWWLDDFGIDEGYSTGSTLQFKNLFNQLALGTGVGLRYDLDFLILRLDLGIGLHNPNIANTGKYFNLPSFKDSMSLHFAIGYPF